MRDRHHLARLGTPFARHPDYITFIFLRVAASQRSLKACAARPRTAPRGRAAAIGAQVDIFEPHRGVKVMLRFGHAEENESNVIGWRATAFLGARVVSVTHARRLKWE